MKFVFALILSTLFCGASADADRVFTTQELDDFLFRVYLDLKVAEGRMSRLKQSGVFFEKIQYRENLELLDIVFVADFGEDYRQDGELNAKGKELLISTVNDVGDFLGVGQSPHSRGGVLNMVRYSNVVPYDKKKAKAIRNFCKETSVIRIIDMKGKKWEVAVLAGGRKASLVESERPLRLDDLMSKLSEKKIDLTNHH
ncbi:hypothetical protein ACVBEJ_14250 [Porticoccus sp. GXU_MW_L64]